jgi:diaminopimelate epimerase
MKIWHMSGAGNDFMVLDGRGLQADWAALAVRYCALSGADGFMAVDYAETADFRLHFYNSDGSRGEMCGNGARCICRFAYEHGLAGESMTLQTDAGPVYGWRLAEDRYRVQLPNPANLDLARKPGVAYVEVGCPHAVTEYRGDLRADAQSLKEQMRALRFDPAFPKGANVNLYRWNGENCVQILTFERGVEDFTLACGTGTGSVACTLYRKGLLAGGKLTAHIPGGTLSIRLTTEGETITEIFLEGPTAFGKVYEL